MSSFAKIIISQYHVASVIGVHAHERTQHQSLLFDIELIVDIKKASQTDNIADTIDYERLTTDLKTFVTQHKFFLIEALAEQLIDHLMKKYHPIGLRIAINKPNALSEAKYVGVIVERGKIA